MNIKRERHVLFCVLIIFLILYSLRFSTIFDENYSLELIHRSYPNVIKFDALDVHPPLYYLLLKLFLQITTFWTKSLLMKIIFSRIFAIIISLASFIFLMKILKELRINVNYFVPFILFLLVPGVISFTYELIKIRMYSLGALFIILESFYLLKYKKFQYRKYLIISILVAILSEYTNYYTAFIAGILFVIYLIKYFIEQDKRWLSMLMSIILMVSAFSLWMPCLLKQFSLQGYHQLPSGVLKQWIASLIFIIIFVYPLIWSMKHLNNEFNNFLLNIFITLLSLFIFMSIVSIIYRPVFQFRYIYPIFLIYGFISLIVLIKMMSIYSYPRYYSILLISLLAVSCIGAYSDQIYSYNVSSIPVLEQLNRERYSHKKVIDLSRNNNFRLEEIMYLINYKKLIKAPGFKKSFLINPSYRGMFYKIDKHIMN